ncbi:MAG: hypothetical protein ACREMR_04980 [Gemmatimonadales bacterium]
MSAGDAAARRLLEPHLWPHEEIRWCGQPVSPRAFAWQRAREAGRAVFRAGPSTGLPLSLVVAVVLSAGGIVALLVHTIVLLATPVVIVILIASADPDERRTALPKVAWIIGAGFVAWGLIAAGAAPLVALALGLLVSAVAVVAAVVVIAMRGAEHRLAQTAYAVTNRRLVAAGGATLEWVVLQDVRRADLRRHADGTGDVVCGAEPSLVFAGLASPDHVLDLIRRTASEGQGR